MNKWTDEQAQAINSRGSNLLVAAAAGSGKTAVLVERVLRIISQDQVDIDRLLIVTFTNAAAAEMRERINNAILTEMQSARPEKQAYLRRQLSLLNQASICTIHSFCQQVVRKYFYLLDIDPNFRIADTTECSLLKLEVLDELIEEEYEKADPHFIELVEMFGSGRTDLPFLNLILKIYEFIQNQPNPTCWLQEKTAAFNLTHDQFLNCGWMQEISQQISQNLRAAAILLQKALHTAEKPNGPTGYLKTINNDLQLLNQLQQAWEKGWNEFFGALHSFAFQRLSNAGKDVAPNLREQAKVWRNQAKKLIEKIKTDLLFKAPVKLWQESSDLYPYLQYLCKLVLDFNREYSINKAERNILDFNDLEHLTLDILKNPEAVSDYRERYVYIFIDEYQDSNMVQETILQSICRENNLFMVGDIKQSIYKFRRAEPALFLEKYRTYQLDEGGLNLRIDLSRNFRSRAGILAGINYIFQQIMSTELGDIKYDAASRLYPGLPAETRDQAIIELYLMDKNLSVSTGDEINTELEELSDIAAEAQLVASKIRELVGTELYNPRTQQYDTITYRDIVVLLRATRGWASEFQEVFTSEGIPVYSETGGGYLQAVEVDIVLNLLKIIDNRRQDIPLLSVMRSPIGNFSITELTDIRLKSPAASYYQAVETYVATNKDQLACKLKQFLTQLDKWSQEARVMAIDDFIYKAIVETGYYYYVAAMPGGQQRQANLDMLVERARQFQLSSIKGLFNFSHFMENIKSSSNDMEPASILGENDNVVRLMSIHKSKGLEFPVVIIAGLGKQFNKSDSRSMVLLHNQLGIGPQYIQPQKRIKTKTAASIAMKKRIEWEGLSEEMRILYVAMTRAQSRLIMMGSLRNLAKKAVKWCSMNGALELAGAECFIDWLGAALIHHDTADKLRLLAGEAAEGLELFEDDSQWEIKILNRFDLHEPGEQVKARKEFAAWLQDYTPDLDHQQWHSVISRLDWKYSCQGSVNVPSKLSVSQIKQITSFRGFTAETIPFGLDYPEQEVQLSDTGNEFSAEERGNILHLFMQHIDFKKALTLEEIESQLNDMVVAELLSEAEATAVNKDAVLKFIHSPLGKRIIKADRIYREQPFNMVCPVEKLLPGYTGQQEQLLVQGIIDLYFLEGQEAVLLDYKTDYLTPMNRQERIDLYAKQLEQYKLAIEQIEGIRVKESYLIFITAAEAVKITFGSQL